EADDAERLARDLSPKELAAVPLAGFHRRVSRGDVAGDGEQERDRVLRGRDSVATRRIHDDDAAARGRGDVDGIGADPGTNDAAEFTGALEYVCSDSCAGADDGAVGGAEGRGQVGALQAGPVVDVDARAAEDVEAGGFELVADQDARHRALGGESKSDGE